MYSLIRPLLFRLDPERAHGLTLAALRAVGRAPLARYLLHRLFEVRDPRLEVEAFGIRFKNPVGLAAGYDKNGVAVAGLSALGFGHLEVGTVTRLPQVGNARPRVHRVVRAQALVNSMGFPNQGANALPWPMAATYQPKDPRRPPPTHIGINLGKGKETALERASDDYCALLRQVHARQQADYVALNVSSPNTLGLRQLQARAALESLLAAIARERDSLTPRLPLLVKIAPDLTESELDDVLAAIQTSGMDGVIATNTTTSREGVPEAAALKGGLSGAPLRARSTAVIAYLARQTGGRLPIIGVGGIASAADALEKLRAGARLVQVYTGLVYTGPALVPQINRGLLRACDAEGLGQVHDLSPRPQARGS